MRTTAHPTPSDDYSSPRLSKDRTEYRYHVGRAVLLDCRFPASMRRLMLDHARRCWPEEACGVLIGSCGRTDGSVRVCEVYPVSNGGPEGRRSSFHIDPAAILAAHRRARELGCRIVGYYHSHPDGRAEPSAADWYGASFCDIHVIVPVRHGRPGRPRAWRWESPLPSLNSVALDGNGSYSVRGRLGVQNMLGGFS